MKVNFTYNATIDRVIDGDTVVVIIDLGFRATMKLPVRLYGIDTMELSNPTGTGREARAYVESKLPAGTEVILKTYKNDIDKYGRWLGEIWLNERINLNKQLITKGFAVAYFGGKKVD